MKQLFFRVASVVVLGGMLVACRDEAPNPAKYELGVLVFNAGNFFQNNGSVSFFMREKSVAQADIFQLENNRPLNGSPQAYAETGGHSLILVDNSAPGLDKVEIVQFGNFKSEATLRAPDIENPRDVIGISPTKAYVTCWGATGTSPFLPNPGYIAVIDLTTFKVTKKIALPKGAEQMVKVGNEVFVGTASFAANGAEGDLLIVVDAAKDEVKRRIKIGTNPSPQALDINGKLWVLTGSSMVRINPLTDVLEATLPVGTNPNKSPSNFALNTAGTGFYYLYSFYDQADNFKQKGATYFFNITDKSIPATKPIVNRLFSGLAVDPIQELIYGGVSPSLAQAGYVVRYRLDGSLVDSVKVEIGPSNFFFK